MICPSNAWCKILIGYANMNAAIWWCRWKLLVMKMTFMRMQMQMYVLVMHGFAPAWACRCKCNQMMMQMNFFLFCKCLPRRCICECYACNADIWSNTHGRSKIHCNFLFKNRLSCLTLNFSDHHQEFFRVRSI